VIRTDSHNVLAALKLGLRSMLQHRGLALLFLLATLAQGALQGLLVWSLRDVLLTFSNAKTVTAGALGVAAAFVLAIWLLRAAGAFAAEVVSVRLSYRVEVESMWRVLAKLLTLSVRFFDEKSQGDLIMSSYYDLKGIRSVTLEIGRMVLYLSTLAGLGIAAWLMSPKLALIGVVLVPLGTLPAYWLGQKITEAARKEREALTTLYDSFLQVSYGIRIIKVNSGESRVLARTREIGRELFRQIVRQAQNRGLARLLLEVVAGFGLISVLIIGGRDVARGVLDWQALLGLLVAVMAVYSPIVGLVQMYSTIRGIIPNLDRVERILKAPVAIRDRPDARRLGQPPAEIELKGVSFAYDNEVVLDSLSARFYRGETIGIVGPSGAGKSTLTALLLRFYDPTEGQILLDGVDLRDIRHADWMQKCAIVLQEPFLFVDTVENNIRLGRPDASTEDVIQAAKAADIHEEIMFMARGYQTMLGRGENARGISVGQKQRICIAAALLRNAPLLFLDEATSNLDSVSERKVQAAIERLMAGRTTFVIAHRLSTLRRVNRLVVLDQQRIVGIGSHEELLQSCPTYQRLWTYQLIDEGERADSGAVAAASQEGFSSAEAEAPRNKREESR